MSSVEPELEGVIVKERVAEPGEVCFNICHMSKLIIGLVGEMGCGKGTMADILREQYGAGYYRFSAILSDILTRLSIEKSRENLQKISNLLRDGFGEDVLSNAIEKDAVTTKEDIVIIDGIRRPEDIVLLEPLPIFKLIAIDVPAKLRYERMKGRGEKIGESQMTWEQFQEQEKAPTEVTIPLVMQRAWKMLDNSGGREEFENKVHTVMKELEFEPKK